MDDLLNQLLSGLSGPWGIAAGVVVGLLGPRAIALLRAYTRRTPTPLDDACVDALEAILAKRQPEVTAMTAKQIEELITTPLLSEVVRLRKARIAAEKKA